MGLNRIDSTGNWGTAASRLNDNFAKMGTEVDKLKYAAYNSKLYPSLSALQAAKPVPTVGDWAIVGNTIPGSIYRCVTNGQWSATGETGGGYGMTVTNLTEIGNVTNMPDDEDLVSIELSNGAPVLKLADKVYDYSKYSGMGRVYLRKNMVGGVNKLDSTLIPANKVNTRFIIQYDYDLRGGTLTIPDGCILDFQGGSFRNGTIVGNNTKIQNSTHSIKKTISISGLYNNVANIEWFECDDIGFIINKLIENKINNFILPAGNYKSNTTIKGNIKNLKIIGNGEVVITCTTNFLNMNFDDSILSNYYINNIVFVSEGDSFYVIDRYNKGTIISNQQDGIIIENCRFRGGDSSNKRGRAIRLVGCSNIKLNNCDFVFLKMGIYLQLVINARVSNCNLATNISPITIEGVPGRNTETAGIQVSDCKVIGNTDGIFSSDVDFLSIDNCMLDYNGTHMIGGLSATITNSYIASLADTVISVVTTFPSLIKNNRITQYSNKTSLETYNSIVEGNYFQQGNKLIKLSGSQANILNNHFQPNVPGSVCISSNTPVYETFIKNNYFQSTDGARAIQLALNSSYFMQGNYGINTQDYYVDIIMPATYKRIQAASNASYPIKEIYCCQENFAVALNGSYIIVYTINGDVVASDTSIRVLVKY